MRNSYLLLFTALMLVGVSVNAQYVINWTPDPITIFGDPLQINLEGDALVTIGEQLNMDEFDADDAAFRLNNGAWHKAFVVENGAISKYQAILNSADFYATEEESLVEFRIMENETGEYFYTEATYYYAKPQLAIQTVQGIPFTQTAPVVVDENGTFALELDAWAKEFTGKELRDGDKRIKALEVSLNADFSDAILIEAPTSANRVTFAIEDVFTLFVMNEDIQYGYNKLYFRAVGEGNDYSDEQDLTFFIFNFEFPQQAYCKYDQSYPLAGTPLGGVFTGECVVSNTNSFNPSLAGNYSSTSVTYTYTLEGEMFSVTKDVELLSIPDFMIEGPAQVCGFEHGAIYNIVGDEDLIATWDVNDDAVVNEIPVSSTTLFVDWGEEGTGFIDAEVVNTNGCALAKRKIVDIGVRKAPSDSADLILNDRMLVCSDTDVAYYFWYHAGDDEFLGRTAGNYFALNFLPSAADSFYVMTAYDTLGCLTQSRYSAPEVTGKSSVADATLEISPNPTTGIVKVFIPASVNNVNMTLAGTEGALIQSYDMQSSDIGYYKAVDLSSLENGIYIMILEGDSYYKFSKVIIAK